MLLSPPPHGPPASLKLARNLIAVSAAVYHRHPAFLFESKREVLERQGGNGKQGGPGGRVVERCGEQRGSYEGKGASCTCDVGREGGKTWG